MLVKGQPARTDARPEIDPVYSVMDEDGRIRPGADAPVV